MKRKIKNRFQVLFSIVLVLIAFNTFDVGVNAEDSVVASVNLTHTHTGNASSGGICYTVKYHVHDSSCNVWVREPIGYYGFSDGNGDGKCDQCAQPAAGHGNTHPYYGSAGHWEARCGKNNSTIDGYSISCGIEDKGVIGKVSILKDLTTDYVLSPSCEILNDKCSNVSYIWNNGDEGDCNVTADGTYTLVVSYSDNGTPRTASCSYTVTDYDKEAPVINSIDLSITKRTNQSVLATVNATDNIIVSKYKLDGVLGDSNVFTLGESGTYLFTCEDAVGNVSSQFVVDVDFIDKAAPVVDSIKK